MVALTVIFICTSCFIYILTFRIKNISKSRIPKCNKLRLRRQKTKFVYQKCLFIQTLTIYIAIIFQIVNKCLKDLETIFPAVGSRSINAVRQFNLLCNFIKVRTIISLN